ncbi:MAG: NAD-dependent epimerase/dehydratase family protein, partial [Acidobacteriota bacterium]
HQVSGLVRDDEKARRLRRMEVLPVPGSMQEPASWLGAARDAQVVVHCAAEYSADLFELDRRTVEECLANARSGRTRLFVYTSGVWLYGSTGAEAVDESAPLDPVPMVAPRAEIEQEVLAANADGLRTLVLRPGCVYGGRGGLTAAWFESASTVGAARIVGEGTNRWAMVHRSDLADAYLRAIESPFGGEVFNVTDRSRFTVRECAAAASRAAGADGRVAAWPVAEAAREMGGMAEALALDQHVDSSKAVRLLGWQPRHGGFVDGAARYHAAWSAART